MITLLPEIVVVGVVGLAGGYAAKIETAVLKAEYPTAFLDCTLN